MIWESKELILILDFYLQAQHLLQAIGFKEAQLELRTSINGGSSKAGVGAERMDRHMLH